MKKLLSTITIIAILGILAAVGVFGYSKYQEVELEKKELQKQADENNEVDKKENNETDDSNRENEGSNNEVNTQEQNTQKESSNTSDNEKVVNRENVFDYLLAEIDSKPENDSSKIKFQEPQYKDGYWLIPANNKSGAGLYSFKVYDDGTVELE